MSYSKECLTQSEVYSHLHELSENENIGDDALENFQMTIIPPDVDALTDEDNLNDNDTENAIVNEFAGTYEINASNDETQPKNHNKRSRILAAKWKKINPVYLKEMTESKSAHTATIKNLASNTLEEIFELLF